MDNTGSRKPIDLLAGKVVSRRVEIFMPILPKQALSPNSGEHRSRRDPWAISGAKMEMRADVANLCLASDDCRAVTTPFDRARVSVTMYWHKRARDGFYRPMDVPNAVYALKPLYDGLQDAGLITDDDYRHMELGPHYIERAEREGLLVTVEEI